MSVIRAVGVLLVAGSLGGCMTPIPKPQVAKVIGEDSAGFSAAYARSANNQILINVLQARERGPRHYLTVSGISDAPTSTNSSSLVLDPLGIGSPAGPLKASNLTLGTSQDTKPSYGVTPMTADSLAKSFYTPLSADRLEYFWRANWPVDVLLAVLAKEDVTVGHCTNLTTAELFAEPLALGTALAGEQLCTLSVEEKPYSAISLGAELARSATPHRIVVSNHAVANSSSDLGPMSQGIAMSRVTQRVCNPVATATGDDERAEAFKLAISGKPYLYEEAKDAKSANLAKCEKNDWVAFIVNRTHAPADVYLIDLRSVDEMIYFLGEQMRRQGNGVKVANPDADRDWRLPDVDLFRVYEGATVCGASDDEFAASIMYRGVRYRAGVPVPRTGLKAEACSGVTIAEDRTGTVITLLTQLYAMAASPEALRPPARLRVD